MFVQLVIASLASLQLWLAAPAAGAPVVPLVVADAGEEAGTEAASARVTEARRALAAAGRQKANLEQTYQAQLAEIDRLKKRKASWRRDRMLRDKLAQSLKTSKRLTAVDERIRSLRGAVKQRRKALLAAIDRELAAGPAAERRAQLRKQRAEVARALKPRSRKIVLPDLRVDPLADPEELEYQAAAIRQSERELAAEIAALEDRAQRYQRMAKLRSKHRRAAELDHADDDRPRRSTGRIGRTSDSPQSGGVADNEASPPSEDDLDPGVGSDPIVVLSDVVDGDTLDALRAAERSSDPAVKARAAKKAREQVLQRKARLEAARKKVEQRARRLRQR